MTTDNGLINHKTKYTIKNLPVSIIDGDVFVGKISSRIHIAIFKNRAGKMCYRLECEGYSFYFRSQTFTELKNAIVFAVDMAEYLIFSDYLSLESERVSA